MKAHVSGNLGVTSSQAPSLHLGLLRRNILAVIVGNDHFTEAEQLRTNHNVYECEDAAQLGRWLVNMRRVAEQREHAHSLAAFGQAIERGEELVAQASQVEYATPAQCDEVYRVAGLPCITQSEKHQALAKLPTLTYAGAVAYIGQLYAKVFLRTGVRLHTDGSTQLA